MIIHLLYFPRWGKGSEEYGEGNPAAIGEINPHPGIAPPQANN